MFCSFLWFLSLHANASTLGLPRWLSGKGPACQCRSLERFNPWVAKILWRREGMATQSSILPGESLGQRSLVDYSP